MLIYISHPYGGKKENKDKIEKIVKKLSKEFPNLTFVSPVHTFGFMYNAFSYERGLEMCLELLSRCHKMLVFGDYKNSRGCNAEILYCKYNLIDYEIVDDYG